MFIDDAIDKQGDLIMYEYSASHSVTGDALIMSLKALRILAYDPSHRLDDASLKLLLNAERRPTDETPRKTP